MRRSAIDLLLRLVIGSVTSFGAVSAGVFAEEVFAVSFEASMVDLGIVNSLRRIRAVEWEGIAMSCNAV